MAPTSEQVQRLVADFGSAVAAKFATGAGEAEDHLRRPVEELVTRFGQLGGVRRIVLAGEDHVPGLGVRPDFAVQVNGALVGFLETKAPGKGADPLRFRNAHDKRQWQRLRSLPNLLYTDGNHWGLYQYGEPQHDIAQLDGRIETAGRSLAVPDSRFATLLEDFLAWQPIPPRNARELALTAARLCRLLREEVRELLAGGDEGLQNLAADWRQLLFPDAGDDVFADGYAQTVTFALLLARVEEVEFADGQDLGSIADRLADRHTLMGTALNVLTDRQVLPKLAGALRVLVRVLGAVHWAAISRGDPDKWLLFYEEFLAEYDPALRRQTGSYYTPNQVADAMVRLVDTLLKSRLDRPYGFAGPDVTVVDPAVGTGTFLFRIIDDRGKDRLARAVEVFTGVQQSVCITIALKDGATGPDVPAPVRHLSITGLREEKFAALDDLTFDDPRWADCPAEWTAPFLAAGKGDWTAMPALDDLVPWSGSGTMPGRTWVRGPHRDTLARRWDRLVEAPLADKRILLSEHPTDRTVHTVLSDNLPGFPPTPRSLAEETGLCPPLERYGYRSFDRQYVIADKRLVNRPNPALWSVRGSRQIYLTALTRTAPTSGPAVTFSALVPDLDYYKGSFGTRARSAGSVPPVARPGRKRRQPRSGPHLAPRRRASVQSQKFF